MDVDELARIEETLLLAIADAKAEVKARGAGPQFREIVRHAREMHDVCLRRWAPAVRRLANDSGD